LQWSVALTIPADQLLVGIQQMWRCVEIVDTDERQPLWWEFTYDHSCNGTLQTQADDTLVERFSRQGGEQTVTVKG